jgi:hypothetical protein
MKHLLIGLVVLLCAANASAQARRAQNTELKIGTINNLGNYLDGCGCYFKSASAGKKSESYIFLAETANSNGNRAWINIDGQVAALKFVSSTYRNQRLKRGGSYMETYRFGNVTARITYVVTSPSAPGGELTKYAASIAITKDNRGTTVKAVGECGC